METITTSAWLWVPITKIGLAMAIAAGLAHVQAAPNDGPPSPSGSTAQVETAKPAAKAPKAHRHQKEVTLAPVKPPSYPSHPLPPPPSLSQKP